MIVCWLGNLVNLMKIQFILNKEDFILVKVMMPNPGVRQECMTGHHTLMYICIHISGPLKKPIHLPPWILGGGRRPKHLKTINKHWQNMWNSTKSVALGQVGLNHGPSRPEATTFYPLLHHRTTHVYMYEYQQLLGLTSVAGFYC